MLPAGSELVKLIGRSKQDVVGGTWDCVGALFFSSSISSFPPILFLEVLCIHTYTHVHTHMWMFCLHIYICTMCVLGAGGRQKKASDFLKLKLMSYHIGGFSARAAGAYNCWAISEVLLCPCIFLRGNRSHLARSSIQRWSLPYSWR